MLVLRLLPLLLPLVLSARRGGASEARCRDGYRAEFVLDAEDAVKQGAVLLATAHAQSEEDCEEACCNETLCNLALREPNGACAMFDCVYKNRFVKREIYERAREREGREKGRKGEKLEGKMREGREGERKG
ncbi:hypothetical protein WMY93_015341 [Mugilogobius chulae]|uniref:MANSC domain-containing protein n=1 Tax=Mugilogobius chulae TaxID=88201 RepID=A0AAW0NUG8_9GOBI